MKANIKYFGMIAEKIGKSEESIDLDEKNQSDLRNYFVGEYPFLKSTPRLANLSKLGVS